MQKRHGFNFVAALSAVLCDAFAVFGGVMTATWLRFGTRFIHVLHDRIPLVRVHFPLIEAPAPRSVYTTGALLATLLFLWIFKALDLYARPQTGTFGDKIPRLCKGIALGILVTMAIGFILKNRAPVSTPVVLLSGFTVTFFVLLQRYALFRWELWHARRTDATNRVLVVGTDSLGLNLMRALDSEPRLHARTIGFVETTPPPAGSAIPDSMKIGTMTDLPALLQADTADQLVLADNGLSHRETLDLILLCERNLVSFSLIPDIFRILTSGMDIQFVSGIPLLGMRAWPLDSAGNRILKRGIDLVGSLAGLVLAAPLIGTLACLIKRSSPGPVFFRQERCGRSGATFTLYKLRTMRVEAEAETGPVWTVKNDPRTTRIGTLLRRTNLDELPQLWNVLRGEMSLVGPRPERPHFVQQFKEDISRYMWRHVSKPGMTGWAQVNGLRGNTSIQERIKHDLFYLENWSVTFDLKILLRTLFARKNAY